MWSGVGSTASYPFLQPGELFQISIGDGERGKGMSQGEVYRYSLKYARNYGAPTAVYFGNTWCLYVSCKITTLYWQFVKHRCVYLKKIIVSYSTFASAPQRSFLEGVLFHRKLVLKCYIFPMKQRPGKETFGPNMCSVSMLLLPVFGNPGFTTVLQNESGSAHEKRCLELHGDLHKLAATFEVVKDSWMWIIKTKSWIGRQCESAPTDPHTNTSLKLYPVDVRWQRLLCIPLPFSRLVALLILRDNPIRIAFIQGFLIAELPWTSLISCQKW